MYHYLIHSENSTYSQAQEVESSAECFADIPASVLSRLNLTHEKSCSSGNETESCQNSLSGTTLKLSTADLGEERSMLSAGASLARTYHPAVAVQESKENGLGCGWKWEESSVKFDRTTSSWKTRQTSLLEGLDEFSETWPRWGMMRDGECWEQTQPDCLITEPECGWLATPLASDVRDRGDVDMPSIKRRFAIGKQVSLSALFKGAQCPSCAEIIMAWPENWSAIEPSGTGKFRLWLDSHGIP